MDTLELIKLAGQGDKKARDLLVTENIGLVWSIVRRFANRGHELDDLFQIGSIGLIKAIDKFDTTFEVKFSTYAVPMITGEIKRFLRDDGMIKVSRSLKETANKVRITREILNNKLGREPTLEEISKEIDIRWEDPVVPRYNGQRSQRAQCSPAPGIETEKARLAIAEQIENIPLPEGYSLVWQGEKIASDQSMKYLFQNFPLAIILMIAILIMLFKDYRKPIIIFCCIPMIFVGVVVVMLLTGKVFNFVAIVGTLGLIGMLIKNGIVLMDEITLQINEGVEPITALIDSSQSRLRPVMMASLTTILGMIPLLSDAMFGSLAAANMGGMLCSTLLTLLFIPILYALFFKIKNN